MSEELVELVNRAMRDGHNQYVHMNGLPNLRLALAEKIEGLYGQPVHPETDITVTPGGTYAIYTALTTILQPGDEVILFEPAYDSYIPNIEINGAIPVPVPMKYPEDNSKGYSIDWSLAQSKVTAKTKAIIINSPHNPTGTVLSESDIAQLRQLVAGTNIFIISDEVYEHLIFDELAHLSMLRYPDLLERSFVCFSFGKVYHCTGWKLGYCVAPAAFMSEFRKVHQFNCFTCNSPVQHALAQFIQQKNPFTTGSFFRKETRLFCWPDGGYPPPADCLSW
jgi:methionine aminotransferase